MKKELRTQEEILNRIKEIKGENDQFLESFIEEEREQAKTELKAKLLKWIEKNTEYECRAEFVYKSDLTNKLKQTK